MNTEGAKANHCTQATPVYGLREFLAQVPGAPGAER
jgi:hypothetical protein